jgi:hypothetical protein
MTPLPITSLYAAILAFVLVALSVRVIRLRLTHEVSLGDGGHDDLRVARRQQGNFVEYVPAALLLLALLELNGLASWATHGLGGTLVLARLIHPFGLAAQFGLRIPRVAGAVATALVIVVSGTLLLAGSISQV